MKISVVVPTRNRAAYLEKFFFSLAKQTLSAADYELIIVDNGSTDETESICRKWGERFINFKYIFDDNPGLHTGRNLGYQQSHSELIVFADDDIIVTDTWLEAIVDGFSRYPDVVLIGGNDIPQFEECPPQWVDMLWQSGEREDEKILVDYSCILLGKYEKEINPYYVFGCNFAVRKWVLDKTHGFHPDGMPNEFLCYRGDGESFISQYIIQNNLKSLFIPGASVYHNVPKQRMDIRYIGQIAYRTGISAAYTALRSQKKAVLQKEIWKEKIDLRLNAGRLGDIELIKKRETMRGKEFLLKSYRNCEAVREWIHRENYLGENGKIANKAKESFSRIVKRNG